MDRPDPEPREPEPSGMNHDYTTSLGWGGVTCIVYDKYKVISDPPVPAAKPPDQPRPAERTDFTRELTELCRRHAVGIEGGRVWGMDAAWKAPDADASAEYAIDADGGLVRTF